MIRFALFRSGDEYIYTVAGNPLAHNFRACLEHYGQPREYIARENWGQVPQTWRGKPLRQADIRYDHDPASGWATDAEVRAPGRPLKDGEPRKQWAARLPESTIESIQSEAESRGVSQSDVVSLAISTLKSGT